MHRIRPIQESDFEAVFSLAEQAHLGFTNLPKHAEKMRSLLKNAQKSFEDHSDNPFYFFVLENSLTKEILGTAGIYAKTANLHYFKRDEIPLPSLFPEVPPCIFQLKRHFYTDGPSEICSLFLASKARKEGLGKLLSLSRFFFMKAFPDRFTKYVFADLRGLIDETGFCPFWEDVGRHFYPVSFQDLMKSRSIDKDAAMELMPKSPLYIDLLSPRARQAIGEPHIHGRPAFDMLIKQGFQKTNEFDLYDAGPRLVGEIAKLELLKKSKTFEIQAICETLDISPVLVSNEKMQFRACFGKIDPENFSIDKQTALVLEVDVGDTLRC